MKTRPTLKEHWRIIWTIALKDMLEVKRAVQGLDDLVHDIRKGCRFPISLIRLAFVQRNFDGRLEFFVIKGLDDVGVRLCVFGPVQGFGIGVGS